MNASRSLRDERGQGLVEYALILALVSLAAIVALGFLSGKINDLFSKAGNSLNTVQVASGGTGTGTGGPAVPTGGSITFACSGGEDPAACDDMDSVNANTSWTSGTTILGYTWLWEHNAATCAAPSGAWDLPHNDGGPSNPAMPQNYNVFPQDVGGTSDAVRLTVTATNATGTSAAVVACVDVLD